MADIAHLPFTATRRIGDLVFVSGQIGLKDGALVDGGIRNQLTQAVVNIESALALEGLTLAQVVDVTVFLVDQGDYLEFNEAYAHLFQGPFPTRTTVTVRSLPFGARVELKVVASIS